MKIGVLYPYPEFGELAKQVASELGFDAEIRKGALKSGIKAAIELQSAGVEAIIARAPTTLMVKESVSIPVIPIDMTNFDVIRAVHKAHKLGARIAFIEYNSEGLRYSYDLDMIQEILGFRFSVFAFSTQSDIENCLSGASAQKADVVLATCACVVDAARKRGFQSSLVYTSKEDFIRAFNIAKDTIEATKTEAEKARWAKTIVDNSIEGIISIDNVGKIQVFNNAAERLTGIPAKAILGRDLASASDEYGIFRRINESFDELIETHNTKFSVRRFPISIDKDYRGLIINLRRVTENESNAKKNKQGLYARAQFSEIIGKSQKINEIKAKAARYSNYNSTILICGDSGTGKELFAQSIHNNSPLSKGPFLAVNCAALPESLLESELFGYEEGAFTGAKKGGKLGLFELAGGGTLFLDEISEMPLPLQACLLRVLQQREIIRLGGDRVIHINTRVICATNKDLSDAVKQGAFREDLYYRINVLTLLIPPLKDRREDIPLIARELFNKNNLKLGKSVFVNSELLEQLRDYNWPGNIRELETFTERLLVLSDGPDISRDTFYRVFCEIKGEPSGHPERRPLTIVDGEMRIRLSNMKDMELQIIDQLLELLNGNQEELSKVLGISRTTLWRRLKA